MIPIFLWPFVALSIFGIREAFPKLATKGLVPEFPQEAVWINSDKPLFREDLSDKAALIHFWNFTSQAAARDVEIMNVWHEKYSIEGVTVIGIHSPVLAQEKETENVRKAVKRLKIKYPIAVDSDLSLWRAYGNLTLPGFYFVDDLGRIRDFVGGAGRDYRAIEKKLLNLWKEKEAKINLDLEEIKEENFSTREPRLVVNLGYRKLSNFGNAQRLAAASSSASYHRPSHLELDRFYLSGRWRAEEECLETERIPASLAIRFRGQQITGVFDGSKTETIRIEILMDGQPLSKTQAGADILMTEGKSYLTVKEFQLYQIFNQKETPLEGTLELRFEETGARAYQLSVG